MPIRINLLAEAQAAEELRRRDPVKRAIWICGCVVALVLGWSGSLQFKIIAGKEKLNAMETQANSQTNEYRQIIAEQRKLAEANQDLAALRQLATNRFLWASVLNALQQTTVDNVNLLQFKGEQSYVLTEESKPRTNEFNKLIPGKPAAVTEKVAITLKARDSGPGPGDQVAKFKESLARTPYFQSRLGSTNEVKLINFDQQQVDRDTGKPCALFTLECRFPEKVR